MLLEALCNDIHVLCLPSHLTHLLQPNDSGYNKAIKDNLTKLLCEDIQNEVRITRTTIANIVLDSIHASNIKRAICASFAHCGIFPFNPNKQYDMIQSELPNEKGTEHLVIADMVLASALYKEARKANAKAKSAATPRNSFGLSTAHGKLLCSEDSIALILIGKRITEVKALKVCLSCVVMLLHFILT
jgi:hypothetical protein